MPALNSNSLLIEWISPHICFLPSVDIHYTFIKFRFIFITGTLDMVYYDSSQLMLLLGVVPVSIKGSKSAQVMRKEEVQSLLSELVARKSYKSAQHILTS